MAGILIDLLIGDPHHLPHPVRAIGKLIAALERLLYDRGKDRTRIFTGALLFAVVIVVTTGLSLAVTVGAYRINIYLGAVVETVMVFYILAAGSLRDESMKVYRALDAGDIREARLCLSMIVGRDTQELDEPAIARAAVETVAENTSDGVIAPLLYTAFLGPAGGMLYKAVNTMDSMIGYRNERYMYFGKVAARADDLFNLIPSRISALFMIVASGFCGYGLKDAFRIWLRDRYAHKSPNSAQTESVCAGALKVRLGGPSSYGGVIVEKPFIGDDEKPVKASDIIRSIRLMFATEMLCTAVVISTLMILISIFR